MCNQIDLSKPHLTICINHFNIFSSMFLPPPFDRLQKPATLERSEITSVHSGFLYQNLPGDQLCSLVGKKREKYVCYFLSKIILDSKNAFQISCGFLKAKRQLGIFFACFPLNFTSNIAHCKPDMSMKLYFAFT